LNSGSWIVRDNPKGEILIRILLLDIETSLHKVFTFSLIKAYIPPKQIIEPTKVLCWAAKWLGQKRTYFRDIRDKDFLSKIYDMIDTADAIIHYNGKAFDTKHLNREFLLAKLDPPSPYMHIDLLSTMRQNFKMASNKLEWVSIQLGYEGKIQHRGIQLWIDCQEHNDPKAWREMKRYNKRDVTEMEPIYYDLLPWIKTHPNWGLYVDGDKNRVCPKCRSTNVKKNGLERTRVRTYQRYKCQDCGAPLKNRTQLYKTPEGVLM